MEIEKALRFAPVDFTRLKCDFVIKMKHCSDGLGVVVKKAYINYRNSKTCKPSG